MKVGFRNKLESFVRCEEQLWPDCGGPLTFLPPYAPDLFLLGFRPPKLRQQLLNKLIQERRSGQRRGQAGRGANSKGSKRGGQGRGLRVRGASQKTKKVKGVRGKKGVRGGQGGGQNVESPIFDTRPA